MLSTCVMFFAAAWEEFYTDDMTLGYINGPIEGLLMTQTLLVVIALKGPINVPS